MPISIQPPQPGDLITSSFVKQLIDQLQMLDARITQLEGVTPGAGGAVSVSFMEPTDLQLGDTLRIHGFNFGLPSENSVTFDGGSPFSGFQAGSGDRLLILKVPNIVFSSDSHLFTVAVSNPRGSDSRQIMIRQVPSTKIQGTVTPNVVFPSGVINPPSAVFRFTIVADTNMDETYNLMPSTVAAAGWTAVMVTDLSGNVVLPPLSGGPSPPPWQVLIKKNTSADVFVKVAIPVSTGTGFVKLDVTSVTSPQTVFGSSRSPDFQVGQPAPPSPTLSFAITGISGPGARSIGPDSVGFTVPTPVSQIDRINFNIIGVKANSSYTMTLAWNNNAANNWTASTKGSPWTPTSPPSWPTSTIGFSTGTTGGIFPIGINLASVIGAISAQLKITVTNDDANQKNDFGIYMPFVGP